MKKLISILILSALSSFSWAAGLTLTASQAEKIYLDTTGSFYSLAINLPSDLSPDDELVVSIFDGATTRIREHIEHENPETTMRVVEDVQKGKGWVFPIKEAVQPNPVISASEFSQRIIVEFSESSKYAEDRMSFAPDIKSILQNYFDETQGVEVWRTGFKHPVSLIPQINPFEYAPAESYDRFSDLNTEQKKVYTTAYKKLFESLKQELEEKCKIVRPDQRETCKINSSDLKITDSLLKTTPRKHYFLELFVEAKW